MFYSLPHLIFFFFCEFVQDKSITCNESQCYLKASGKHNTLLCKCRYAAGLHSKAEMAREVMILEK